MRNDTRGTTLSTPILLLFLIEILPSALVKISEVQDEKVQSLETTEARGESFNIDITVSPDFSRKNRSALEKNSNSNNGAGEENIEEDRVTSQNAETDKLPSQLRDETEKKREKKSQIHLLAPREKLEPYIKIPNFYYPPSPIGWDKEVLNSAGNILPTKAITGMNGEILLHSFGDEKGGKHYRRRIIGDHRRKSSGRFPMSREKQIRMLSLREVPICYGECAKARNCTKEEFECDDGFCIEKTWLCDGSNDCADYSDESKCIDSGVCALNEFRCNDGKCISSSWKCDSENDCTDGSDEANCGEVLECTESKMKCAGSKCVKKEFKCDGDNDCGDWSDEMNCSQTLCGPFEFKCSEGICVPELWKCDNELDCENGQDESNCTKKPTEICGPNEFSCTTRRCIPVTWVCDNIHDCSEGEDEKNCNSKCRETEFDCEEEDQNSLQPKCIGKKHVCDGRKDCQKGKDEINCPKKVDCKPDSPCQQLCIIYNEDEQECDCNAGFTLSEDKKTCRDINECEFKNNPVCSQICNNTVGSFTCLCEEGYVLRPDGRTCKRIGDPPSLILGNRLDIRQVNFNNLQDTPLIKGLHDAIAIDSHLKRGWIYWSDVSARVIQRMKINKTEKSDVIKWGLNIPGGIAVDWIHDLLFWTDSGARRVEVATLDGDHRTVIVSDDLNKPKSIVVHPEKALIFWIDWEPRPKIEVAEMDGGNRRSLVKEGEFWPNDLTLDYSVDRIYWTDAKRHVIESSDLNGNDRKKIVIKGLPHPISITLFKEDIYWIDQNLKSIGTAKKNTGAGYQILPISMKSPVDIHSFHPQSQPFFRNRCGKTNGGCSHLCLPNKLSYRCSCPIGLHLHSDGKTCKSSEKVLVFATSEDIQISEVDEGENFVIPLDKIRSPAALTTDPDANMTYWSDTESHQISRGCLNGSHQEIIIKNNLASPSGLAIDWVTKKLYWTDAGTNLIEVSTLNGSMRSILFWENVQEPRDIVVDPIGGYLYFSGWGNRPRIEKAGMNGSNRRVLFSDNLILPNGLAIDYDENLLYWVDGGTKAVEFSKLDGTGRTLLKVSGTDVRHPFGLALLGERIYYTDRDTNCIHFADKKTGENGGVLRRSIFGLMDVEVFHQDQRKVDNPCVINNGGCSHLCLIAPVPENYTCACPIGIRLLRDGKTCASRPKKSLVLAHEVDLRELSLDVGYFVDSVLPFPPMKGARGVDFDRKTDDIYWTDFKDGKIMKGSRSGFETVLADGLIKGEGIAIDSAGRKIYWTDSGRKSVEVCELDGTNGKVLIWTDLENPKAITLDYNRGAMFWSDWRIKSRIERADLNGENRITLLSGDLERPSGLAVDYSAERLYWSDGKLKTIESSDFQGQDRRVILEELPHPYGLDVSGTHIYWTDLETKSVHRADKYKGKNRKVVRSGLKELTDIKFVQEEKVDKNACGNNNGGCSHLCLRKPFGYSCNCPTGLQLKNDSKTCDSFPSNYILVTNRRTFFRISLDTAELFREIPLPIAEVKNAIAIDYYFKRGIIYYADVGLGMIRAVNMGNLSDNRAIIADNLTTPSGLAVDWLSENIFWSDSGRKVIEVARLDGSSRKVIIDKDLREPRALAVFPTKGYVFWADTGDEPKIERSFGDGSKRFLIAKHDLGFPTGLATDYDNRQLFWADSLKNRIEMSDFQGRNRRTFAQSTSRPFGLSLYKTKIYWMSRSSKSLNQVDRGNIIREIKTVEWGKVTDLKVVTVTKERGWSPCQENNGYCSHLCLFRDNDYVCGCPDAADERPCKREPKKTVFIPRKKPLKEFKKPDFDPYKSELDDIYGVSYLDLNFHPESENSHEKPAKLLNMTNILSVVFSTIFLLLIVSLFWYHRKTPKRFSSKNSKCVLTFSNPNYSGSVTRKELVSEGEPFLWTNLQFDKSEDRIDIEDEEEEEEEKNKMAALGKTSSKPLQVSATKFGFASSKMDEIT